MLDVLIRATKNPIDYSPALLSHSLVLKEKIQESETVFSFIFTVNKNLSWKAGQHSLFYFKDKKVSGKSWRAFSVASSMHEDVIRIGTIITKEHSDFKDTLMKLTPGEEITMRGPFGEFSAKKKDPQMIGVAGGIGITPFRALAYEIAHNYLPNHSLTLIYSAKEGQHTYKTELDEWAQNCDRLKIIYTNTADEVNKNLDALITEHKNTARYYLSGSPGMITAIKKSCGEKGITRIVNDPFKGY